MPPLFALVVLFALFAFMAFVAIAVIPVFFPIAGIGNTEGLLRSLADFLNNIRWARGKGESLCLCQSRGYGSEREEESQNKMLLHGKNVLMNMNFSISAGARKKGTSADQS